MDELSMMLENLSDAEQRRVKDYFHEQKQKSYENGRVAGLQHAQKVLEEARSKLGKEPIRG